MRPLVLTVSRSMNNRFEFRVSTTSVETCTATKIFRSGEKNGLLFRNSFNVRCTSSMVKEGPMNMRLHKIIAVAAFCAATTITVCGLGLVTGQRQPATKSPVTQGVVVGAVTPLKIDDEGFVPIGLDGRRRDQGPEIHKALVGSGTAALRPQLLEARISARSREMGRDRMAIPSK